MIKATIFHSRISRRMIFSFLFVTVLSISLLGFYLLDFFYTDNLKKQTLELTRNARIAEILLADELASPPSAQRSARLEQKIHTISAETALRITLMNASGIVLADSSEPAESLDNHLQRPEVQGALQEHQQNSSIRYSTTLHENMLYTAIPVYTDTGELQGIIRTAASLSPIEASYDQTRHTLLIALLGTILLVLLVSLLLARRQIRPIQQMTEDAIAITQGDLQRRLHIHTQDELEVLARTINQLTSSLAQKIQEATSAAHRQALILENMDNGLLLLDHQGKILTANRKAQELFRLQKDHLGKSSIHALGSTLLSRTAQEAAHTNQNRTIHFSLPFPDNTKKKSFSVFFAPFPEKQENYVLCVFHDISLLQELSQRQNEFVANAAHELATPLTSISGFAETLLDDDFQDPETSHHFINTIYREAQRMSRLIKELLQLARLDRQEYREQIELQKIPAASILPLVRQKLLTQATKKEQQIELSIDTNDAHLEANQDLLLQLIVNLTENAIKYTPAKGTITLRFWADTAWVYYAIRDTGIGIAPQDLPFIFDRFYRADKARSRASGGNGIGLSLVHFLVELFGGKINVKSKLQEGTEFLLQFPRC